MSEEKIISAEIIAADFEMSSIGLAVRLFVRALDGKKYLLKDYNFKPYFLLSGENLERLKEKIIGFEIKNNCADNDESGSEKERLKEIKKDYVTNAEIIEKRVGLEDKKLLKIYVDSPNNIIKIKDELLKKLNSDKANKEILVFEYDIPFEKRYLLDNGLTPFTQYDFICLNLKKEPDYKRSVNANLKTNSDLEVKTHLDSNYEFNAHSKLGLDRKFSVNDDFNSFEIIKYIKKPDKNLKEEELINKKEFAGKNRERVLEYSLIAFDIETYVSKIDEINPKKDPILMITFRGQIKGKDFYKALVSKKINLENSNKTLKEFEIDAKDIEFFEDERTMIERFFSIIRSESPDFLVGYNSDNFDLRFVSERAKNLKIDMDFGFLGERVKESQGSDFFLRIPGVVNFDLYKYLRRAGGRSLNVESYSLNDVSKYLLGEEKLDLDPLELTKYWESNNETKILEFVKYCIQDSNLTFKISKSMLPSLIEQSRILSLLPEDTSRLSFSQLVEWFLIRKSCDWNYLIPNRPDTKEMISRRTKRFEGAFVFQPKPNLYQRIAVFDFRSLYPTIIISHNISPETYNSPCPEDKGINVPDGKDFFSNVKKGFLSRALDEIVTKRIKIKGDIKELDTTKSYSFKLLHAQEQTLKTIANSTYGYLGYERARWYCFGCAKAVTAFGRHYIHNVIDTANKSGFAVLYSDTDSVFIQLNEKSIEEAKKFVEGVNNGLPKGMELEYEGFYKRAIFVFSKTGSEGAKKRYALIDEQGNLTIKGFETIRRNWSNIGKKLQREVLKIILDENDVEKAMEFVMKAIKDVKERKVNLSDLVITTKLTKKISSYSSIGPHVTAAIRMREKGINVEPGTLIRYVVSKPTNSKGRQKISDNVMLFEDATIDDYDDEYYIEKQLVPAIESIFKTLGKEINLGKGRQSSLRSF